MEYRPGALYHDPIYTCYAESLSSESASEAGEDQEPSIADKLSKIIHGKLF